MMPLKWTPEEEEILRSLYESDAPFEEIASKLPGRTPMAIRLMANRLKLRRPSLPGLCPQCGRPLPTKEDQAAAEARPRGAPYPAGQTQAD
jgi:hypothetical protein